MVALIDNRMTELNELCRAHHVRRLEIVGSAADGTFDPQRSDLDFLVDFFPFEPGAAFDTYFGLLESLEALFGRMVDLVDATCLTNPYFIRGVNESRRVVFEIPDEATPG